MVSKDDFKRAVKVVEKSGRVLISTHIRPDGDACGCMVALKEALESVDKKVELLLLSPLPDWYEFIFDTKVPVIGENVNLKQLQNGDFDNFDLIVIVDVNSEKQLPGFADYLKQNKKNILAIDHHRTSDGLGDVELVDTSAAASAIIMYDWFKFANWNISPKIAEALFVATATDTGWFRFDNTDSKVLRTVAELVKAGVKPDSVYHNLYQNFSIERFRLMTYMLNSLELHLDDRLAVQQITQQDFKNAGAAYKDTENLIDECRRIASVEAAALFIEAPDGRIRCSLRSAADLDVGKVAQFFGGGGHKMAAGMHLEKPIKDAKIQVIEKIKEQFQQIERIISANPKKNRKNTKNKLDS